MKKLLLVIFARKDTNDQKNLMSFNRYLILKYTMYVNII